jgi:hypothetical protein
MPLVFEKMAIILAAPPYFEAPARSHSVRLVPLNTSIKLSEAHNMHNMKKVLWRVSNKYLYSSLHCGNECLKTDDGQAVIE